MPGATLGSTPIARRAGRAADRSGGPRLVLAGDPDVGPLTLRRQTLVIAGAEDQVIIVYQPQPGSPSADALARLL